MVSVFSLPFMRYFRRKILPSAGVTSRYRPPPSNSLAFFPASVGLAFLIWRSFRGIFGVCFRGYFQIPPNIPPLFASLKLHGNGRDWTIRKGQTGWKSACKPRSYWIWFMALDGIRQKNNRSKAVDFYSVVRTERLELSHLSAPEPKSGASTNFATSAL